MTRHLGPAEPLFRLWIARYRDWQPVAWHDVPPVAIALEAIDDDLYSAADASQFLAGFNGQLLVEDAELWCVAVPLTLRIDGDLTPGVEVRGHAFGPVEHEAV